MTETRPAPIPCPGCALTPGAEANIEPHNHIKARLCVLGGTPFFCHEGMDWQNPIEHLPMTKAEFRTKYFKICGGWVREVRRLADAGYFDKAREVKRAWAHMAGEALGLINLEDDPAEKAELIEVFRSYWMELHKMAGELGYAYEVSAQIRAGYSDEAGLLLDKEIRSR